MFFPNVAQRDYLLDYEFSAANVSTYGSAVANRGITALAYAEETYGVPYLAATHGFKTTITTQTTTFGVSSYSVTFDSPWWSGTLLSSPTLFLSTLKIQIDVDGVEHNAGCNAWDFSFTELRIYSVDAFGTRTLLHTIAGSGDSGAGYDPRDDNSHVYNQCNPYLDSTGGIPNCTDYATRADYLYSIDVSSTFAGFWKWRTTAGPGSWTEDDITLATVTTPTGNVGCTDCDDAVLSPTGNKSYHMALSAGVQEGQSLTNLADINCYCPGPIFSYHMHYWRFDFNRDQHDFMEAWLAPKTHSIRAHTVRVVESCDENGSMSSYDHTNSYTDTECVSIWNSQRYKKAASRWCTEKYGLITPCAVEPGHDPVDATCDVIPPSPVYCYYGCQVLMSWPTKPPCGNAKRVWNAVFDQDPQLGVTWVDVASTPQWFGSPWSVPEPGQVWDVTTAISADTDVNNVSFGRDPRTWRLWALVERDGLGIYSTYSDDEGRTWANLTSVVAGVNPFVWFGTFGGIQCWMDDSASPMVAKGQFRHPGDTAWSSTFTFKDSGGSDIQLADGGMCNVTPAHDMQDRLIWSPILLGDTIPTTFFSADYGLTWQPL